MAVKVVMREQPFDFLERFSTKTNFFPTFTEKKLALGVLLIHVYTKTNV